MSNVSVTIFFFDMYVAKILSPAKHLYWNGGDGHLI